MSYLIEQLLRLYTPRTWLKASLTGLAMVGSLWATSASALDTVTIRLGPLSQAVSVDDLETFSRTGIVPDHLKLYRPLLTPDARALLQSHVNIDPAIASAILDEVLQAPGGKDLRQTFAEIAPDLSFSELQQAIEAAAAAEDGLSVLGILRAIPQDSVEVDVSTLLSLMSQINLSRMEGEALGRVLENELVVTDTETDQHLGPLGSYPAQSGPETVEQWDLTLRDYKRDRTIPVDLYWSHHTRGPLVVMSHGFGADRRFLAYMANHLASYGLTVVSVEHPGSNVAALASLSLDSASLHQPGNILPAEEFVNRPQDISFVLDRLKQLNRHSYSLRGRLNTDQVTLIGHSLGGYTGLALAGAPLDTTGLDRECENLQLIGISPADWLQCAAAKLPSKHQDLSDPRITQLIVMNPITGQLFGQHGISQVRIPTLLVAGTRDSITPIASQQLSTFDQLAGPKYLVTVVGGTHLSVGDPENLNPELVQVPFMPELPGKTTSELRQYLRGVTLSFILQQTPEAEAHAKYLTPDYAQQYSTADLPLRFSQALPKNVQAWLHRADPADNQRETAWAYLPSLMQLEAIDVQHRFRELQQQMVAYLRNSPPSLSVVYLPRAAFRPQLRANANGSGPRSD